MTKEIMTAACQREIRNFEIGWKILDSREARFASGEEMFRFKKVPTQAAVGNSRDRQGIVLQNGHLFTPPGCLKDIIPGIP